jgi:hypothetical protein
MNTARVALRRTLLLGAGALLAGCAALSGRDPLRVDLAGIEPLPGEGLELRLAIKLRVQNPNDTAIGFDGAALDLEVDGRTLASGVTDQGGNVPRFGEAVLTIPVTISAWNALRQAMRLADASPGGPRESLPIVLRGKLAGGPFGTTRFTKDATLRWSDLGRPSR